MIQQGARSNVHEALFILYVRDQRASHDFYAAVLDRPARLDVEGMTEFQLTESSALGLMPEAGIKRLLGERLPDPARGSGVPRAELYLFVQDPAAHHARAVQQGAREIDGLRQRNWGDWAAYSLDPDGHVLAFASKPAPSTASTSGQ